MYNHEILCFLIFFLELGVSVIGVLIYIGNSTKDDWAMIAYILWFSSGTLHGIALMHGPEKLPKHGTEALRTLTYALLPLYTMDISPVYAWMVFVYWPLVAAAIHGMTTAKYLLPSHAGYSEVP
jgi:hypothetical protein